MKKLILLPLFILSGFLLMAQVVLKPSIGIGDLPADDSPVCDIPLYLGNFEDVGLEEGDTLYDFNLFSINNEELEIGELLLDGLPVLLVNGSYTCPVFRGKVPLINQIASDYVGQLHVAIIYTVEAHPFEDISPYFGFENVGNANIQQGILYNQPTTYGERKTVVSDMLDAMDIEVPVYLDGPCNNWWETFGPAPNNAYLINTNGKVVTHHGWFNKYPEDIICDIDELLVVPNNCDLSINGQFEFFLQSDSIMSGEAGETISITGVLQNNSIAGVEIEVKRIVENVPTDWATSICLDICYPTDVDYTTIHLEPGEEQIYTMYFYTGPVPGEGMTRMGFRNLNDQSNLFRQNMFASTNTTSTVEVFASDMMTVFPNPTSFKVNIHLHESFVPTSYPIELFVYNLLGGLLLTQTVEEPNVVIDMSTWEDGIYLVELRSESKIIANTRLIKQ